MKKWLYIALAILAIVVIAAVAFFIGQENPPITKTAIVTVEVRPSPSFTLEVTPENIITYPNRTIAFNALCTGTNEFAGVVIMSASGLPAGVTVEFFPSSTFTLGLEPRGVQINITFPDDQALVGIHTLTVKAVSTNYN